jgi:hypothetical protein
MNNCVVFCLVHKEEKKGQTRVEKGGKNGIKRRWGNKNKKKEAAKNINL